MSKLELVVNAKRYGGWKSIHIKRSIESIAGSFDLVVSDKWEGTSSWGIAEEDVCAVTIDDEPVIDGYVDKRSLSVAGETRSLSYSGRDRAAALVDCSAVLAKWTFRDMSIADIARKLCAPFGIKVTEAEGLFAVDPRIKKIVDPRHKRKHVVNPGDTAFQIIQDAAKNAEVLVISDGVGGVVITRPGRGTPAQPVIEGQNLLAASADFEASSRFRRYIVIAQHPGGSTTRIKAEAVDPGVRRAERVLMVRSEKAVTGDYAKQRGDWEARTRAAKAETVIVSVQGWRQPNSGKLWPVNALCYIESPSIGVKGQMLISEVEYALDEGGERTTLHLLRPDAFTPEPNAEVKASGGLWKELAKGAK